MDAPTLTRSWPALAAFGAGLIQLALGAGALTTTSGGPVLRAAAVVFLLLGAAALVWGIGTLAHGRVVLPRVALAGSLAGIVIGAVVLGADPVRTSIVAVAAASLLLIITGAFCAIVVRRARPAADGRTGMIGMIVGAALISALVTPALASTEAGRFATDHGGPAVSNPHGH